MDMYKLLSSSDLVCLSSFQRILSERVCAFTCGLSPMLYSQVSIPSTPHWYCGICIKLSTLQKHCPNIIFFWSQLFVVKSSASPMT